MEKKPQQTDNSPNEPEKIVPSANEVTLSHGERLALTMKPLIPKLKAIDGLTVNGDVLAVIKFPTAEGCENPPLVGIVDYGEFDINNAPPTNIDMSRGRPIPYMGRATSRYGLSILGQVGEEQTRGVALTSDVTQLGRDTYAGSMLGFDQANNRYDAISREHLVITRTEAGLILEDMSSNGTSIQIPG